MKKTLTLAIATAFLISGCSNPPTESSAETTMEQPAEKTARERLEAQGIVYSTEDWETTTSQICARDKPDLYMGMEGAITKHNDTMTSQERANVILSAGRGGEAPNAGILTDREKQMIIDVVTDDVCDPPVKEKADTRTPTRQAYDEIRVAGVQGITLRNIGIYIESICSAVDRGVIGADRVRALKEDHPEWSHEDARTVDDSIAYKVCNT